MYQHGIVNINYKARVRNVDILKKIPFRASKPFQFTYKTKTGYTVIIFPNGTARIMGCKEHPSDLKEFFPFDMVIERVQSATIIIQIENANINLVAMAQRIVSCGYKCQLEQELFPALRYTSWNPLCVNVFASGKIVILGLKVLNYVNIIKRLMCELYQFL